MTGSHSRAQCSDAAEVRLELTTAEVRQVFALYAQPLEEPAARGQRRAPPSEAQPSAFARDLAARVWKSRRAVALAVFAALALGVLHLLTATPTYGVTALVVVEQRSIEAAPAGASGGGAGFLAGQAEILRSAPVVQEALRQSGIHLSAAPGPLAAWLAKRLPLAARTPAAEVDERDAVAAALDAFSVAPVPGTEVISLEYRTRDAAGGERFLQAVIDAYGDLAGRLGPAGAPVFVRTLAAPTRLAGPLWPRPLPVLASSLVLGLLAGAGLAFAAGRVPEPETCWMEVREPAWGA
jgi:uncharacterized protein involved in exopolysaccharide biosynthesis